MTPRALFLAVSLLANAALVAAFLATPRESSPTERAARVVAPEQANAVSPAGATAKNSATKAVAAPSAQPLATWASIDTTDLDEFYRRLKAAGFTAAEIRSILAWRVSQLYSQSLSGDAAKTTPYWRPTYRADTFSDPERRKQMVEQQRLYRKYLGSYEGLADDPDQLAAAKRRWGDLPVDKLVALAKIESDYEELRMQQYAERQVRPGETGGPDAYRMIEQEQQVDIARVLTPEEFATYELRGSPTATQLRFRLETFKPNEDEYKTIYAITKAYENRWNDPSLTPDARTALNKEITAKVQEALGPDRALDYDAAMNQNSTDQTAGLVSRLNLPARVAAEVRQAQTDFTQRAKDIRANTTLSASERDSQLTTLARQAQAQLTAKLGPDGFEAYNDVKGEWLRAIQPKPGAGGR